MLTVNLDTEDHLINGSMGTIKHVYMSTRSPLDGTIYVQFDDPVAGNKRKRRDINEEWVPILAEVRSFNMNKNVTYQRKQFPGILGHAITIHKSQGSTYQHMQGHMNEKLGKPGMAYTMLSRAQNRSGIKLHNFKSSMIATNKDALTEMNRMREESVLKLEHTLLLMPTPVLLLLNVRSWNSHIIHHTSDPIYLNTCSILCFTETKVTNRQNITRICDFDLRWDDIHYTTAHGLAICYQKNKIKLVRELQTDPFIEAAACIWEHEEIQFIVLLVYRTGPILNFVQQITEQIREFQRLNLRIILLGDFNLDQNRTEHFNRFSNFKQEFLMEQKSKFPTHNDGGILDLIFDNQNNTNKVHWLPTSFSDHFTLFYSI